MITALCHLLIPTPLRSNQLDSFAQREFGSTV